MTGVCASWVQLVQLSVWSDFFFFSSSLFFRFFVSPFLPPPFFSPFTAPVCSSVRPGLSFCSVGNILLFSFSGQNLSSAHPHHVPPCRRPRSRAPRRKYPIHHQRRRQTFRLPANPGHWTSAAARHRAFRVCPCRASEKRCGAPSFSRSHHARREQVREPAARRLQRLVVAERGD